MLCASPGVPVCLKKKHNARKAVWFTLATVHWSNFSIFVDSIDSQIILQMICESKTTTSVLALFCYYGDIILDSFLIWVVQALDILVNFIRENETFLFYFEWWVSEEYEYKIKLGSC